MLSSIYYVQHTSNTPTTILRNNHNDITIYANVNMDNPTNTGGTICKESYSNIYSLIYMDTLQQTIVKRRLLAMTAVKDAQLLDCAQFYAKYEKHLEWDEVSNLSDFNDGTVNLIYHGTDYPVAILFCDGTFIDWAYCS